MKSALKAEGAMLKTVATRMGEINASDGSAVQADYSFLTTSSVLFDAVYVPGGAASVEMLSGEADAYQFVDEAYRHCKAIAATAEAIEFIDITFAGKAKNDKAVILGDDVSGDFIAAIAQHRNWEREKARKVPA